MNAHRLDIVHTFSIVAADPRRGICGAAVASKVVGVGALVPYVRAGVGAFCTQHWRHPGYGERALDLLERGLLPEEVFARLLKNDKHRDKRQLGIVDMDGRALCRNLSIPDTSGGYFGSISGRNYACQGNTLADQAVILSMAIAFERTKGSLADRMLAALAAGDRNGGDRRGRLSASLHMARSGVKDLWLRLDVDEDSNAVEALLQKYLSLKHPAKGRHGSGERIFR